MLYLISVIYRTTHLSSRKEKAVTMLTILLPIYFHMFMKIIRNYMFPGLDASRTFDLGVRSHFSLKACKLGVNTSPIKAIHNIYKS